jgi:hypothetical protein
VVVVLGASNRVLAGQADYPPAYPHAPGRRRTFPVCANRSNMSTDHCFVLEYAFTIVVIVLSACDRVLAGQAPSFDRPPASQTAPSRPGTAPACANRLNMSTDLHFMLQYVLPAVVAVWSSQIEFWLIRLAAYGRPPAHQTTFSRPGTFPACANHSNMFSNLRFMLQYVFPAVVAVWSSQIEFWLVRLAAYGRPPASQITPSRPGTFPACANGSNMLIDLCFLFRYTVMVVVVVLGACDRVLACAHPHTTSHLIALALFPYAQITPVCPLTFVCNGICICCYGGCAWCLRVSSVSQACG